MGREERDKIEGTGRKKEKRGPKNVKRKEKRRPIWCHNLCVP